MDISKLKETVDEYGKEAVGSYLLDKGYSQVQIDSMFAAQPDVTRGGMPNPEQPRDTTKGLLAGWWKYANPFQILAHPVDFLESLSPEMQLYERIKNPREPEWGDIPFVAPIQDIIKKWKSGDKRTALGESAGIVTPFALLPLASKLPRSMRITKPLESDIMTREAIASESAAGMPPSAQLGGGVIKKSLYEASDATLGGAVVNQIAQKRMTKWQTKRYQELMQNPERLMPFDAGEIQIKVLDDLVQARHKVGTAAWEKWKNDINKPEFIKEVSVESNVPPGLKGLADNPELVARNPALNLTKTEKVTLPVDLEGVQTAVKAEFDMLEQIKPGSPEGGYVSKRHEIVSDIVKGNRYRSAEVIDEKIKALKWLARKNEGNPTGQLAGELADMIEEPFGKAVTEQAGGGVYKQILEAREKWYDYKYAQGVAEKLSKDPVTAFEQLIKHKDKDFIDLKEVTDLTPETIPALRGALHQEIFKKVAPTKVIKEDGYTAIWREWEQYGDKTKALLYKDNPALLDATEHFMLTLRRLGEFKTKMPHAATLSVRFGSPFLILYNQTIGVSIQVAGPIVAKMLNSEAAVRALTEGLQLPVRSPASAMAVANLLNIAKQYGTAESKDQGVMNPFQLPVAANKSGLTQADIDSFDWDAPAPDWAHLQNKSMNYVPASGRGRKRITMRDYYGDRGGTETKEEFIKIINKYKRGK